MNLAQAKKKEKETKEKDMEKKTKGKKGEKRANFHVLVAMISPHDRDEDSEAVPQIIKHKDETQKQETIKNDSKTKKE
ncbi:hypothetical protein B5X24_HaOG202091 [Helicoverpa armigera]|uniref:Uncharacterized protein n=1 Tax=Helicoverpa armigera TaxID=29058 RepID=A0A2W1BXZ6_HELAM|nr:hypothetical protein B5X24_HaOG202091 [Helicoverpa armigera]